MKILYETLPKDLRINIYPDQELLLDYIQGSNEENPYLSPSQKKRDDMYQYFQDNFSKGRLFENEMFFKVMLLENIEDDKLRENIEPNHNDDGTSKGIDYKAVHNEMYYVEYKLIPHFVEMFDAQPDKASQIVSTIYENLVTLQNNLRKVDPFAFGKVTGEVLGRIENKCLVVFEFPKPFDLPLAKYGAIYLNREKGEYQYLTLEFSLNGKFVLGSKTKERHYNYGQREDISKDEFIQEVCQKVGADESMLQPRIKICRKNMIEMDDQSFLHARESAAHLIVCFYDFNKPSQMFIPILDQVSQEYYDRLPVGLYDVYGGTENSLACPKYDITALPTLLFFKEGKLVNRQVGICRSENLRVLFDQLLKY